MQPPTEEVVAGVAAQVVIRNTGFEPRRLTVAPGTTVTWVNEDKAPHTITAGARGNPNGRFDSGAVGGGKTFSVKFDEAGTFDYFCSLRPGLDGAVDVRS